MSRTDIGKKIKEGLEEATKTAVNSAESVSKGGEKLGRTSAFRAISQVRAESFWIKVVCRLFYHHNFLQVSNSHLQTAKKSYTSFFWYESVCVLSVGCGNHDEGD